MVISFSRFDSLETRESQIDGALNPGRPARLDDDPSRLGRAIRVQDIGDPPDVQDDGRRSVPEQPGLKKPAEELAIDGSKRTGDHDQIETIRRGQTNGRDAVSGRDGFNQFSLEGVSPDRRHAGVLCDQQAPHQKQRAGISPGSIVSHANLLLADMSDPAQV
jgi:hypothetical protein